MGKHTQPKALKEIYEAIESLEKQGIKPTISEVAKSLGKAYDTINGTLNYHKQKDLLTKLRTYQEYPKQNRSDKQAIHRVREAIAELNAKGTKTTTASVGSHLGISKQRVHQILKEFNELSSLGMPQPVAQPEPAPVAQPAEPALPSVSLPIDLPAYLESVERNVILAALDQTGFNRTAAAKLLGLSFRQLRYRMQQLGIRDPRDVEASPGSVGEPAGNGLNGDA